MTLNRKLLSVIFAMIFLTSVVPAVNTSISTASLHEPLVDESSNIILSEDTPNKKLPKSILVYTEFADHDTGSYGELKNTYGVLNEYFLNDYHIANLTDYTELNSVLSSYDVLLIPEQEDIYQDNITDIGVAWSTPLTNFVVGGGVIVLMDCNGANVPDGPSLKLLNETGLISVFMTADFPGSTFTVVDTHNALARGLPSTFPGSDGSVRFEITDGTSVVNDSISTVVAHKTMGAGHIALLGFDMWEFDIYQKQLLRNAIQLSRHVVFDQSHNPLQTIQAGYLNYSNDLVEQGFAVSSMPTFAPEVLDGCDVLVTFTSQVAYNSSEVATIDAFVQAGGGLFIITDYGSYGEELDPITDHFGFVRNKSSSYLIETDTYDTYDSYVYYNITDYEFHSILLDVSRVEYDRGGGFVSIPSNGIPLVRTDTDGTSFWSDGSPADGVITSAAAGVGMGRVAVLSDVNMATLSNPDADSYENLYDSDNEIFLYNFIHWCAGGGEEEKFVMFDESHGPNFFMNASYFGFARFLTDNGYTVRWNYHWDSDLLTQSDILVVQDGNINYTASELAEIKSYVAGGGGLCILGGYGANGLEADLVGNEFGLDMNNTGYLKDTDDYLVSSYHIVYNETNFGTHPIMDGVSRIELYSSTAFLDIGAGTSLVSTDNDGTATWNDGSPADDKSIMVALEHELGRVFFAGDYIFPRHNSDYDSDGVPILYDSDNDILLSNAFFWLSENRAPIVEVLSPNGGEELEGTVDITWDAIDQDSDEMTFSLFYSSNGGTDWIEISTGLTSLTHSWNTTGLNDGTNYLIRVEASDGELVSEDISDAVFTIDNSVTDTTDPPLLDDTVLLIIIIGAVLGVVIIIIILKKKK
ncbi:MAG: fibronectin type III domain-containing protein [Candidatus Thorarchaeota archaeon]